MLTVPIRLIRPSPNPIRKTWDEDKMQELAASIKERGVIVPIKVRPIDYRNLTQVDDGSVTGRAGRVLGTSVEPASYEIVYGHRRVEASRRAGLIEVPAIVEPADDTDALIQALIENVQREDMEPMDEARAIQQIQATTDWSLREMERRGIGSHDHLSLRLSLLDELPEIQALITRRDPGPGVSSESALGVQHIRETRAVIESPQERAAVLHKAANEGLTRKETRATAEAYNAADTPELRDAVLNTSGKLGDADRILQVAQMKVGVQGIAREREYMQRKAVEEWDRSVAEFLDMFKLFDRAITKTITAANYDKFSPEAKAFTVRKIDGLIANLQGLRKVLSNE